MTATKAQSLSNLAIFEIKTILDYRAKMRHLGIAFEPFESDLEAKEVFVRLAKLYENQTVAKNALFAPKTDEVARLRSLRVNMYAQLVGAKNDKYGANLKRMKNRALVGDLNDLQKHASCIRMRVAETLYNRVLTTVVPYRPYSHNETMVKIITNLALYFSGNPIGDYDLKKGLYMHGDTRVGKTTLFEALQVVFKDTIMAFDIFYSRRALTDIATGVLSAAHELNARKYGNLLIDDISKNDPNIKMINGNVVNVIASLYDGRLERGEDTGCLTHFTSNFSLDELMYRQNQFGTMFFDVTFIERIRDNCNIIAIPLLTNH